MPESAPATPEPSDPTTPPAAFTATRLPEDGAPLAPEGDTPSLPRSQALDPETGAPVAAMVATDNGYSSHGEPVIWTRAGYVDFEDPARGAAITMPVIATALSRIPRFGGHTSEFYTVAEHSIWCSRMAERSGLPLATIRAAFLHDAPEAIIGDTITTQKRRLPQLAEWESAIWRHLADRFGLPEILPPAVKAIDLVALATEKRDLMPGCPAWPFLPRPDRERIRPNGSPRVIRQAFMVRARQLGLALKDRP